MSTDRAHRLWRQAGLQVPRRRPRRRVASGRFTYYPGTVRVPEGAAPDTKNKSFTVIAEVEIPQGGADSVPATQGGRFGGWGMLILGGKPEFDYAFSNQQQHKYRVASNEKLAPGKHTIKFESKYDSPGFGKSATGTLWVDGKQVAQVKIERTGPHPSCSGAARSTNERRQR